MKNNIFFQPISGFELPRFAGMPTFMRLPNVGLSDKKISEVDIGIIGAPWDAGTTNRPGPRHGPRQGEVARARHGPWQDTVGARHSRGRSTVQRSGGAP